MYGLVNAAVKELVVSKFGAETWEKIRTKAGVKVDTFSRMDAYPDDITYKMVGAASEVLGISGDDVLKTFGEFWVLYTGKEGYGHMFTVAGQSLREFLFNLDNLHTRIGQNFPELIPPSFTFDVIDDKTVRMHYHSERKGLCPMVEGLLKGLATHFKTTLVLEHPVCSRQGAAHCEWLLTMSPAAASA